MANERAEVGAILEGKRRDPIETGIAAERRVLDLVRACDHVKRARMATAAEDREGIDLVAILKCGHSIRLQVKAGNDRKPAGYYAERGIVVVERAIVLPLALLERHVRAAILCSTCPPEPKPISRMLHAWVPAPRGWRCARSGCRIRSATIDDSLVCDPPSRSGERLAAFENRRAFGLSKKGKRR